MIGYNRRVYPEMSRTEFDKYIYPILKVIEELKLKENRKFVDAENLMNGNEMYPYHNSSLLLVGSLWNQVWDNSLDNLFSDFHKFKHDMLESLANLVFSYFIRCFAEQIKSEDLKYSDYQEYNKDIKETGYKVFSEQYPIIWNRCTNLLHNKIKYLNEMLTNISCKRELISKTFGIKKNAGIIMAETGGDTHNQGKSVSIISFDDGNKLIYKPRSVKGEMGYATLVNELNENFGTDFHVYKVLDFENYGFISFIKEDESFMDMGKAGEIACLMYLLNATDMHYSNILWSKEGPIPIDLETLFHVPRIKTGLSESPKSAYAFMENSVYSTGVLPIQLGKHQNSVDVGFAGVRKENNEGPIKPITIVDGFSKDISVKWAELQEVAVSSYKKEEEAYIFEKCDSIIKGFTSMYRKVLKNKELFREIVEKAFEGAILRYIHNMTYRYEQILRSMSSPQAARDISICHALLSRVAILSISSNPEIILSECRQLWRGDVPYFSTEFSSRNIMDDEKVICESVKSPKECFEEKMDIVSEEDLLRQIKIIRLSFVAKLADPDINKKMDTKKVIKFLADKLKSEVMDDHFSHLPNTWVGPVMNHLENVWMPGVLGYDLYSGRIGPGVALALASKILNEKKYSDITFQMFNSSANILEEKKYEIRNLLVAGVGLFSGYTSILWGLNEAGKVMEKEEWCQLARESFSIIDKELATVDDNFFDMISGKSAPIIFRHKIDKEYRLSKEQLDKYIVAGEKMLENRGEKTTIGLAHGLCHIIWFFSVLNQIYFDEKVVQLVRKTDEVIKSEFVTYDGEFIVYEGEKEHFVSSSWCNGLSGILLSYYEGFRAGIFEREDVSEIISKLVTAYKSDLPIFCHGTLGIEEVLDYISKDFKVETEYLLRHLNDGMCSSDRIYNYYEHEKGRYTISPGFMSGQSGAICFLGKKLGVSLDVSPITFGGEDEE